MDILESQALKFKVQKKASANASPRMLNAHKRIIRFPNPSLSILGTPELSFSLTAGSSGVKHLPYSIPCYRDEMTE